MKVSALDDNHRREALTMEEYHGWQVPAVYSNLEGECESATTSTGIVDLSCYGRIEVTGADRADLLHRLSTNDLLKRTPGEVVETALVTDKGRLIDLLLLSFGDAEILVISSPGNEERVVNWIGKYTITEDIKLKSVTSSTTMICLVGSKAFSAYESLFSGELERGRSRQTTGHDGFHLAVGGGRNGLEMVHIVVPNSDAPRFWEHTTREGNRLGVKKMGLRSFEALRVAYGIPSIGSEISDSYNPLEVGLRDAISFTKGCYIGQEVIARLDTYGKVQKVLVGLEFKDAVLPPGSSSGLSLNERAVGSVTSVLSEKIGGRFIGLGVVRLDASAPDTLLNVQSVSSSTTAIVTKLPMTT